MNSALLAISTLIIATTAAWISRQQMLIARMKLNNDVFDRRIGVFLATQDYLFICLNRNGGEYEDTRTFYEAVRTAPFIFGPEVSNLVAGLFRHSAALQVYAPLLDKTSNPERGSYQEAYDKALDWVNSQLPQLESIFVEAKLSNVTPIGGTGVFSLATFTAMKQRIATGINAHVG